jgi:hypothetical protein
MFSQKERHSVARHLREHRKARLESVFPINLKSEAIDVELLAPRVVSHPQRRHHALLWILIAGHRRTPSSAPAFAAPQALTSDSASHY